MSKNMQGILTAIALMLVAVLIYAIYVTAASAIDNHAQAEEIKTYEEEYLPGQPLDAVKVNAPTFSTGQYAYKVCDRTSGACWWLVKDPDGKWRVLPVCEGRSYVAQQTGAE